MSATGMGSVMHSRDLDFGKEMGKTLRINSDLEALDRKMQEYCVSFAYQRPNAGPALRKGYLLAKAALSLAIKS